MLDTYNVYPKGAPAYSNDTDHPSPFYRIPHSYLELPTPAKWAAQMLQSCLDEEHEAYLAAHEYNYHHVSQVRRRRSSAC